MGYRICKDCGVEKHLDDFPSNDARTLKSGIKKYKRYICKPCFAKKAELRRNRIPWEWIKNRYKISSEEAEHWYKKSMQSCEICGKEWQQDTEKLCIDHSHTTGKIRGILCKPCNHLLGFSYDNIQTLERAKFYLLENGG